MLFPIEYTDPSGTMPRVIDHLTAGGSVVFVTTHPSMEDIARGGKLMVLWEEIRKRRIGTPAAVHQKLFVELATALFDFETVYVPTHNTRKRRVVSQAEENSALVRYKNFVVDLLQNNSILGIESQADQMSSLGRPEVPVVGFVLSIIQKKRIPNVLFVPVGIEIEGINGNYAHARNISLVRHPYIFHVGQAFTADEVLHLSNSRQISPDEFMYREHRTLVPPEYLSEQSDLS